MSITFNEEAQAFNLQTPKTSYIIHIWRGKYLMHVYWGKKINTPNMSNAVINRVGGFTPNTDNEDYSLDYMNQEYPTGLGTDYRVPAISAVYADGSRNVKLLYDGYKIEKGKPKLQGLPATYVESEDEAETLYITLVDKLKGLKVILMYTVFNKLDVITRTVKVVNESTENIILEKVLSACVDFETYDYDFIDFHGGWGKERFMERTPLRHGIQLVDSKRGSSSHQLNPFFMLAAKEANEEYGDVYGFNFVYSGNFTGGVEVDCADKSRVWMGLNEYDFSWKLEPAQEFQAPEVVMVYSKKGFGEMSRTYHKLYRTRLVRGKYRDEPRPILVNNWEATYFDFNEDKIIGLANAAKELGIELLVLDDGWFGKRNGDNCSLGDWYVNREKLPNGISGLAKKVNEIGLKFGLWVEPEMISVDSDLYREHPDWCIHVPDRIRTEARNQLILDLSRKEVCDYIVDTIGGILKESDISYIKWDMNRNMSEFGSVALPADRQKEMPHRYMLGLYDVMERITSAYPDVLFEGCSGGGGRFDPGILYYMPQIWTSDDTDAVERLRIQYGTSMAYPISTMGAHVSAVPNHQTGRVTSLKTRGDVAMSGNFGYELDLMKFTDEEKEEVKAQIEQYKELRTFVQAGDMYRLKSPFRTAYNDGNDTAWMVISEDGRDIFAAYFRKSCIVNGGIYRMKFVALDPEAIYEIVGEGARYSGDELMEIGLMVDMWGEYTSMTWRLKKL